MSLNIYTTEDEIPKKMLLIRQNDKYFNGHSLVDDALTCKVLSTIDSATFASPNTFIGRDPDLGELNKQHLSTGCKTLINVINNPKVCFDVVECGVNVLKLIPLLNEGNILWKKPILHYVGNCACDILIHGKHFTDFRTFLKYIMG